MRTPKTVEINDTSYTLFQFPATQGLDLGLRLSKLVAPVIAPLAEAADTSGGTDITGSAIKAAADGLVANLNSKDTVALVKELLSVVACEDGKFGDDPNLFDRHFTGRLGNLPPLLREVVAHNFSDFFSGVLGMVGSRKTTT